MAVFRKKTNFIMIDKTPLLDERLSWKAKGIIAYMFSMSDEYITYSPELLNHSIDDEISFRSDLKELIDYGYIEESLE